MSSQEEVTIKQLANELLDFKGRCPNVDVEKISKQLLMLDAHISKYEKGHKQVKK